MALVKSPWEWSNSEVIEFLQRINLCSAVKDFQNYGINGKDLLELTENDLRSDFRFLRVHDRKSLIRSVSDLRKSCALCICINFSADYLYFRIGDINLYDFDTLLNDCSKVLHIPSQNLIIKDSNNIIMGSGKVQVIYRDYIQSEKLYLKIIGKEYSSSSDMDDVNEDNPYIK